MTAGVRSLPGGLVKTPRRRLCLSLRWHLPRTHARPSAAPGRSPRPATGFANLRTAAFSENPLAQVGRDPPRSQPMGLLTQPRSRDRPAAFGRGPVRVLGPAARLPEASSAVRPPCPGAWAHSHAAEAAGGDTEPRGGGSGGPALHPAPERLARGPADPRSHVPPAWAPAPPLLGGRWGSGGVTVGSRTEPFGRWARGPGCRLPPPFRAPRTLPGPSPASRFSNRFAGG